jgi:hypothetical protein
MRGQNDRRSPTQEDRARKGRKSQLRPRCPPLRASPRRFLTCPFPAPSCTASGASFVRPVGCRRVAVPSRTYVALGLLEDPRIADVWAGCPGSPEDPAPWVQRWPDDRSQFDADERRGLACRAQRAWPACSLASAVSLGVVPAVPADGRCHRAMAPMMHPPTHAHATSKEQAVRPCARSQCRARPGSRAACPHMQCQFPFVLAETRRDSVSAHGFARKSDTALRTWGW